MDHLVWQLSLSKNWNTAKISLDIATFKFYIYNTEIGENLEMLNEDF